MKTVFKVLAAVAVIGMLAAAGWVIYSFYATGGETVFRTEKIACGTLLSVISSSGTVEPEELVNVGAQVTGKIMSFGTDADGRTVDYGSKVTKGMVLARIDVFGPYATKVSMSSTKSSIGHLLGAAGAVEAIFCLKALQEGILPPTLNLEDPIEGAEDMDLVALKAKERKVTAVMSNSFGFGGTNASVIFKAV